MHVVLYSESNAFGGAESVARLVLSRLPATYRVTVVSPQAQVVDQNGESSTVPTYAFAPDAMQRRRFEVLEQELRRRHAIQERRLGNGCVLMVRIRETVECVRDMSRRGVYFYDLTGLPHPHGNSIRATSCV